MRRLVLCLCCCLGLIACGTPDRAVSERPASWATPMIGSDLENWYKVSDKLYRSQQPNVAEIKDLQKIGINHILNLRFHHSDAELQKQGLTIKRVPMNAGGITQDQVIEALKFIQETDGPVLVHCWHGSDRTGCISAAYRVVIQGWDKQAAIDELMNGGYGFHSLYDNIPVLIKQLEVEEIKKQLSKTN